MPIIEAMLNEEKLTMPRAMPHEPAHMPTEKSKPIPTWEMLITPHVT